MSDVKKFPGYRWSPEGEVRVFNDAADVPEGWTDFHPGNKTEEKSPPAATSLTRQQIIDDLRRRGVVFQRNATTKALHDLLVAEIERTVA